MEKRGKSVLAWTIKTGDTLSVSDVSDDRDYLVRNINRPAGQKVVRIRISEVEKNT